MVLAKYWLLDWLAWRVAIEQSTNPALVSAWVGGHVP